MNGSERYLTLSDDGEGSYRDRGSKFIAYAFPIHNEDEFKERATLIKAKHPTARHLCYAWVLGEAAELSRANDDGEPNGTAGRPILNRIQALGLTYCAVAVVRHFGGTLLGKGGLVKAFGESARSALENATIVERTLCDQLVLECGYALFDTIKNEVLQLDGELMDTNFGVACKARVALPKSIIDSFIEKWSMNDVSITRVDHLK